MARRTTAPTPRPVSRSQLTEAERDLLAHLMATPVEAADAVTELEPADLVGLAARALLEAAQALARDERAQGRSGSVASRLLSELGEVCGRHGRETIRLVPRQRGGHRGFPGRGLVLRLLRLRRGGWKDEVGRERGRE